MFKLIKYGVLLVLGILFYNYFLGTPDEKADAKDKLGKVKDFIGSAFDESVKIIKSERQKFKDGKYDGAVDKVGGVISKLKDQVVDKGGKLIDRLDDLELRKDKLKKKIKEAEEKAGGMTEEEKADLTKEFEEISDETEKILEESKQE